MGPDNTLIISFMAQALVEAKSKEQFQSMLEVYSKLEPEKFTRAQMSIWVFNHIADNLLCPAYNHSGWDYNTKLREIIDGYWWYEDHKRRQKRPNQVYFDECWNALYYAARHV
jgi:hypothetical protein